MTDSPRVRTIKQAQKERLYFRVFSELFSQLMVDDSRIYDLVLTRTKLSSDKSICTLYFYSAQGEQFFKEKLEVLKLYRPSLRKAFAAKITSRYTPELRFAFDTTFEKQEKFEHLMESIKQES